VIFIVVIIDHENDEVRLKHEHRSVNSGERQDDAAKSQSQRFFEPASGASGRYFTPFKATGISAGMMIDVEDYRHRIAESRRGQDASRHRA